MMRWRKSRLMNALVALVWCGTVAARPVAMPCPMGGHGAVHPASHPAALRQLPTGHEQMHEQMHEHMHEQRHVQKLHGEPNGRHGIVSSGELPSSAAPNVPGHNEPNHSENPHHPCDCLAHCCASSATMHSANTPAIAAMVVATEPSSGRAYASFTPVWVDYLLPFAMAPPVSAYT